MNKIYRKLALILTTGLLVLSSCAAVPRKPALPIDAFVKIETQNVIKFCDEEKKNCKFSPVFTSSGSGILINHHKNKSYVTTAGHVCAGLPPPPSELTLNQIAGMLGLQIEYPIKSAEFLTNIIVHDIDGNQYKSRTMLLDGVIDLCLLETQFINHLPAKLSTKEIPLGGTVWNLAAPYGIFYPNAVPIFRGIMFAHEGVGPAGGAGYSDVPARPGSSGRAALDDDGRVVGIIHSIDARIPQIAYGASRSQLRCFLFQAFSMEGKLEAGPALIGCSE